MAAGMVPRARPRFMTLTGSVAMSLSASASPTRPPSETTMAGVAPPSAWAQASTRALWRARVSSGAGTGGASEMAERAAFVAPLRSAIAEDRQGVALADRPDHGRRHAGRPASVDIGCGGLGRDGAEDLVI